MIFSGKPIKPSVLLLVCTLYLPGIFALVPDCSNHRADPGCQVIDLFDSHEAVSISLVFDIKNFLKTQEEDSYADARFIYHLNDSSQITKEIGLKARGHNRREVCKFPPLWINISGAGLLSPQQENIDRIKLVTYCSKSRQNNIYVLKEYLAYRIYNLISPYSFRVRLARIRFIDTGRKNREYNSWGFFIEPEEMMAERLDAKPVKRDIIGFQSTDPPETDIMSMYQYIIGNADYSILSRQNIKLIMLNDPENRKIIPVPYDFDYSGFVNAHYAIPGESLGISSVRERYFLGPCRPDKTYYRLFDHFFAYKKDIYSLVRSFEHLDSKTKEAALAYLDEFFEVSINDRYIRNYIKSTCREAIINDSNSDSR